MKDRYIIVQAPSLDILAMLVDGHMGSGYTPTGGIASIPLGLDGRISYCQALYLPPQESVELSEPASDQFTQRF